MEFQKAKNIHMIGIGGIGVSSIAHILHKKGKQISGSDSVSSKITQSLKRAGIEVFKEHNSSNVSKKHDLVIYSPAIPEDNPELQKARELKIKTLSYPQALGEMSKQYFTIAVAGTHGKSTTTAIISLLLTDGGLDPTVVIGTKIHEFGNKNYRVGKSEFLVMEACEYKDSFLNFHPDILVLTNIEYDHPDYFKTFDQLKKSFISLANNTKKGGVVLMDMDDKHSMEIEPKIKAEKVFLTRKDKKSHFHLSNNLFMADEDVIQLEPQVIGEFNLHNCAMAASVASLLGVSPQQTYLTISQFRGTWRRMEIKKTKLKGPLVIDDYAHHPTEIEATLGSIRKAQPKAKVLCVYQPHQYNRTHHLLKEFGASFKDADEVIVPNIYRVRDSEQDIASVSTDDLVAEITKNGSKASNGQGLKATADWLKKHHKNYDIILTMGAGDVDGIYKWL